VKRRRGKEGVGRKGEGGRQRRREENVTTNEKGTRAPEGRGQLTYVNMVEGEEEGETSGRN
jgi:hypothetical protein